MLGIGETSSARNAEGSEGGGRVGGGPRASLPGDGAAPMEPRLESGVIAGAPAAFGGGMAPSGKIRAGRCHAA